MKKQQLFGLSIISDTKKNVVQSLTKAILNEQKAFVVTANPGHIMLMDKRKDFKQILQSSTHIVPDGIGIMKASELFQMPLVEKIPGIELMQSLLSFANDSRKKVYLLGAREEVLQSLLDKIRLQFPNVDICGSHHGYFLNEEKIVTYIQQLQPDVVFVALGAPKQEEFIAKHLSSMQKGVFIGVGGSFDVLSGKTRRAPLWCRKLQLEWLYRIVAQPSRLRKSSYLGRFIVKVVRGRIREPILMRETNEFLLEEES